MPNYATACDYFIFRVTTKGEVQLADDYNNIYTLDAYIADTYLQGSPVGERYFVVNRHNGFVLRNYVVEQGEKRLVRSV